MLWNVYARHHTIPESMVHTPKVHFLSAVALVWYGLVSSAAKVHFHRCRRTTRANGYQRVCSRAAVTRKLPKRRQGGTTFVPFAAKSDRCDWSVCWATRSRPAMGVGTRASAVEAAGLFWRLYWLSVAHSKVYPDSTPENTTSLPKTSWPTAARSSQPVATARIE